MGQLFGESTRKSGLDADWKEVHPDVLHNLVWAISQLGGSVTIGVTRNGNAYSFKIYVGAPYDARYFDGDAEGREAMAEWVNDLVIAVAEEL